MLDRDATSGNAVVRQRNIACCEDIVDRRVHGGVDDDPVVSCLDAGARREIGLWCDTGRREDHVSLDLLSAVEADRSVVDGGYRHLTQITDTDVDEQVSDPIADLCAQPFALRGGVRRHQGGRRARRASPERRCRLAADEPSADDDGGVGFRCGVTQPRRIGQ